MYAKIWNNWPSANLVPYVGLLLRTVIVKNVVFNMTLYYILNIQIILVDGYNNTASTARVLKTATIEIFFSNILLNFLIKLYYLLRSCVKKLYRHWVVIYVGLLSAYCVVMKTLVFFFCTVYWREFKFYVGYFYFTLFSCIILLDFFCLACDFWNLKLRSRNWSMWCSFCWW